jgi:hypothetical protein
MAWLEAHQSLSTHRKLYALAAALRISRATAAGHILFLWFWALDNAPSGDLTGVDNEMLKLAADWPKKGVVFVDACVSAGFMDRSDTYLVLHDWGDYAGRLADKRERNKTRMRCARNGHDPCVCSARATHGATHVQKHDETRAGLQNRTVQNRTEPSPPPADERAPDDVSVTVAAERALFAAAAGDEETRCYRAFDGLVGSFAVTPTIGQAIRDWLETSVSAYPGQAAETFEAACADAALHGAKNLKYVFAILERWGREGRKDTRKKTVSDSNGKDFMSGFSTDELRVVK